jgi:hypothetical protein
MLQKCSSKKENWNVFGVCSMLKKFEGPLKIKGRAKYFLNIWSNMS